MVSEYLESLKERGKWNFSDLSKKTGLSESTIRRIFTDPDNNPTMDTLVKLVVAMGGSIDRLVGIENPSEKNEETETEAIHETLNEIRDLRNEMLSHQRESYERELESLRGENERLRREKKTLRNALTAAILIMITLMFATIVMLIYDMMHLDRGWFQAYYGIESGRYGIGSVLQDFLESFRRMIL